MCNAFPPAPACLVTPVKQISEVANVFMYDRTMHTALAPASPPSAGGCLQQRCIATEVLALHAPRRQTQTNAGHKQMQAVVSVLQATNKYSCTSAASLRRSYAAKSTRGHWANGAVVETYSNSQRHAPSACAQSDARDMTGECRSQLLLPRPLGLLPPKKNVDVACISLHVLLSTLCYASADKLNAQLILELSLQLQRFALPEV